MVLVGSLGVGRSDSPFRYPRLCHALVCFPTLHPLTASQPSQRRILTRFRIAATLVAAGVGAPNRCTERAGWRPRRLRTTRHRRSTRPRTRAIPRRRAASSTAKAMDTIADSSNRDRMADSSNNRERMPGTRRAFSCSRRRAPTIAIPSTRLLRDLRRMPANEWSRSETHGALEAEETFVVLDRKEDKLEGVTECIGLLGKRGAQSNTEYCSKLSRHLTGMRYGSLVTSVLQRYFRLGGYLRT